VSATKSADLSVDGYTVVGPAITFAAGGSASGDIDATSFAHGIDFVVPIRRRRCRPIATSSCLVKKGNWPRTPAPWSTSSSRARTARALPRPRRRHLSGRGQDDRRSEVDAPLHLPRRRRRLDGGFGSSVNFWLHPDRYGRHRRHVAPDPGPDMTYTLA